MQEYEDMTPRELMLHLDVYNDQQRERRENDYTQAYMTAYWHRVSKLPPLDQVLKKLRPKPEPQTDDQMLAQVRALQAQFGGGEV